jgi:hypothetical protein
MLGAAPFRAAEQAAVKVARGGQIVDRKGQMEGWQRHQLSYVIASATKQSGAVSGLLRRCAPRNDGGQ